MAHTVDVIIPTFNNAGFTLACLRSLAATTPADRYRVIWVDNGSDVQDMEAVWAHLQTKHMPAEKVCLSDNLGFVKATNVGLAIATAPYVLLLNNDCELPPGWLDAFLEVFEREPGVGIVGPLSSSPHQWQGNVGASWKRPYSVLGPTNMLSFFCAMIRREVIVKCGYLSEEYRAGLGDDDDYCECVKREGWGLALRTDLLVTHHHRTTFRSVYGEDGWLTNQEQNLAHFRKKWGR